MRKLALFIILSALVVSLGAMAKENKKLKKFNHKLMDKMEQVLNDNPEKYEKKNTVPSRRAPASVEPYNMKSSDSLDDVDEQADTVNQW